MKKTILIIVSLFCFMPVVKANTLNSVDITVELNQNGDGYVTEVWSLDADEGTESYHSFGNMQNRSIENFSVTRDETEYTAIPNWDVSASKEEKANKNGINYTSDGLELCYGIEYGLHTYTSKYTIKNLVWQYSDNQIMYFQFLPKDMNPAPKSFTLNIKYGTLLSDIKYSSYGFNSTNTKEDSQITFKSNNSLTSSDYVVVLVGFPNGTFTPAITQGGTYNDVASKALKGVETDDSFGAIISIFVFIICVLVFGKVLVRKEYDESEFIIPKEIPNFRDIPFDKDIIEAYFIGKYKSLIRSDSLIGCLLLKWIKNKNITIVPTEGGLLDFNKADNYYLDLTNLKHCDHKVEATLMGYLQSAADNNSHLTSKQFEKWCRKNYEKINKWLKDTEEYSKELLINKGYITKITNSKGKKQYKFTASLRDEFIKLKGLKQFLCDMTVIEDKKAVEVHLWDEYLIFAEAFGIAEEVAKQFKDFHPAEYDQNIMYYNSCYSIHYFSHSAMYTASNGGSFSSGGGGAGGASSGGGVR